MKRPVTRLLPNERLTGKCQMGFYGHNEKKNEEQEMRFLPILIMLLLAPPTYADQHEDVVEGILTYLEGISLYRDGNYEKAVKLFRKAAEKGDASAQILLGRMYLRGEGVPKDDRTAVKWYRKAAEQGHADAQYRLGRMYDQGRGASKDVRTAAKWVRKAAEQGDADAQFMLAGMYDRGRGVPRDARTAAKWYRKAAEQGHADAQYELGEMYAHGRGMVKNDIEAYKWVLLSAAQGNETARKNIPVIEERLTPAQREKGQAVASAWQAAFNKRQQ